MKKADVLEMNRIVDNVYDDLQNDMKHGTQYISRLRSCSAEVWASDNYYILRSYSTIIACIDSDGNCYDFLRKVYGYTATSAQHIAKFQSDYGYRGKRFTWYYI